jgi:hypothetical protein
MLRTRAVEVSLWEAVLPDEVLPLPDQTPRRSTREPAAPQVGKGSIRVGPHPPRSPRRSPHLGRTRRPGPQPGQDRSPHRMIDHQTENNILGRPRLAVLDQHGRAFLGPPTGPVGVKR